MKKLILLFATFLPLGLLAQQYLEDVIYLKDGSVYRGVIIEQVPNESMKIQIMGGSVIAVLVGNVSRMTKEVPFNEMVTTAPGYDKPQRIKLPFEPRLKGYFFQSQLLLEAGQLGVRIVNGYKFGRLGHLGIGIGLDGAMGSPFNNILNELNTNDLSGAFLPLYVYYAGDILDRKITPFYAIEAGYAAVGPNSNGMDVNDLYEDNGFGYSYGTTEVVSGGVMGSVGFGVRFNTRRRINFSLLMNINFKNVTYEENYYIYDDLNGYYDSYGTRNNATLLMAGLRFGIGF